MLVLVGCNHRSAPVELRERLAFDDGSLPEALGRLLASEEIVEGMILSTCNRVEVLARGQTSRESCVEAVERFLTTDRAVEPRLLDESAYRLHGSEAVRHLFRVASGLDSMILGEPQILGQMRHAFMAAHAAGATGTIVERALQQCMATAKRVRTETGVARHAVSVARAAVGLARQIFGEIGGCSALVVGAGKMGELVAKHLRARGVEELLVTSRTYDHAVSSASRVGGRAVRWETGLAALERVDVVVSCTGAAHAVIELDRVRAALGGRRRRPLFLIDIAVPRDVDPAVNQLDNVYLYDIDALQKVVDSNLDERRRAASRAERAIVRDVEAFDRWRQTLSVTPTIVAMRERLFELSHAEVARFRRRLSPLSPTQEREFEAFARSLVQKILHGPVVRLKGSVERGDTERCAGMIREIFQLDEPEDDDDGSEAPDASAGPRRIIKGGS